MFCGVLWSWMEICVALCGVLWRCEVLWWTTFPILETCGIMTMYVSRQIAGCLTYIIPIASRFHWFIYIIQYLYIHCGSNFLWGQSRKIQDLNDWKILARARMKTPILRNIRPITTYLCIWPAKSNHGSSYWTTTTTSSSSSSNNHSHQTMIIISNIVIIKPLDKSAVPVIRWPTLLRRPAPTSVPNP